MGEKVGTPDDMRGQVTGLDVIRQKVKVLVEIDEDNKEIREYDAAELTFKPRGRKNNKNKDKGGKGDKDGKNRQDKDRKDKRNNESGNNDSAETKEQQDS